MSIADLRREYTRSGLQEAQLHDDPVVQFGIWMDQALQAEVHEPNAMTLATASPGGEVSARTVLLKAFDQAGFCFFTNYTSRKAQQLEANPHAALLLYWNQLERQVRIEGSVQRVDDDMSDRYFQSRPHASRIGAWASEQSAVLTDRAELEARVADVEQRFPDDQVPRPPFWGGYRLLPQMIEFWQGRAGRLHDRLRYSKNEAGSWQIERLSP